MSDKKLRVCAFCGTTGKNGAQFKLCTGAEELDVHKFCGEKLLEAAEKHAPAGTVVRLVHWSVLRAEKREAKEKLEQERVSDFWASKFSKALARKAAALNGAKAVPANA